MANRFAEEQSRRQSQSAPANPFAEEQKRRVAQPSNLETFTQFAGTEFGNNMLAGGTDIANVLPSTPQGASNLLTNTIAGVKTAGNFLQGDPTDFFGERENLRESPPFNLIQDFQTPTVQDVEAGIRSIPSLVPGGETPSDAFSMNLEEINARMERSRETNPFMAGLGEVSGDVATIAIMRIPALNKIKAAEEIIKTGQIAANSRHSWLINKVMLNPAVRSMARGVFRAGEASAEAMTLDILKGDHPLETAGWVAGHQLAGSMALQLLKSTVSGPGWGIPLKIAGEVTAVATVLQILKSGTPGGEDDFGATVEEAFDHVTHALVLGVGAGMLGKGRMRGTQLEEAYPIFADMMTSLPRAAAISKIEDWVDGDSGTRAQIEAGLQRQLDTAMEALGGPQGPPQEFQPGRRAPGNVGGLLP